MNLEIGWEKQNRQLGNYENIFVHMTGRIEFSGIKDPSQMASSIVGTWLTCRNSGSRDLKVFVVVEKRPIKGIRV